jgi:hypothetical protein
MKFLDKLKALDAEAKEGPWIFDSKVLNLTRFLMANTQAIIELVEAAEKIEYLGTLERVDNLQTVLPKLKGDV